MLKQNMPLSCVCELMRCAGGLHDSSRLISQVRRIYVVSTPSISESLQLKHSMRCDRARGGGTGHVRNVLRDSDVVVIRHDI
jgi:hypothetical protein